MTYKAFLKELGIKLKQQRKKLELNQSELIEKINKGLTKNDDDFLMKICGFWIDFEADFKPSILKQDKGV